MWISARIADAHLKSPFLLLEAKTIGEDQKRWVVIRLSVVGMLDDGIE